MCNVRVNRSPSVGFPEIDRSATNEGAHCLAHRLGEVGPKGVHSLQIGVKSRPQESAGAP